MDENHLIKERKRKLEELKKLGIEPYAYRFDKKHNAVDILNNFNKFKDKSVSVAGRIMSMRGMGKATFMHIQDSSARIQLYFGEDGVGKDAYKIIKLLDIGDIIGCQGQVFKTKKGEISVNVKSFQLLTKSLIPLPEKWHGLKDQELRYRQRYVDLIMNPTVKEVFEKRARIKQAIREFMEGRGFVEVDTPILQPIYGGASARPFKSHLNALNMSVYMRISNELYLKRLIAGGYERIFEFSKDFRNEGVDKLHNPEFEQVETMWAYADYKDNMKFCEEFIEFVAKKVLGTTKIKLGENKIDLKAPWKKIQFIDVIKEKTKIDFNKMTGFEEAKKAAQAIGVDVSNCQSIGEVMVNVFEQCVQAKLIQPTIVYNYPKEAAILANIHKPDQRLVESFEPIINGWEIGLSYCEQNDPEVLKDFWKIAEAHFKEGDVEAQRMDHDFLRALEYGMPPTSGLGIGIDRLTIILTNSSSIRDVIFFPFMRPEDKK